jgi:hypothetical protein
MEEIKGGPIGEMSRWRRAEWGNV